MDLSICIAARNEMFLSRTIKDILEHSEVQTEVIVVYDGDWPDPPVEDHPRVHSIYHPVSVGQRAAINEAARMSTAKYIMKADAHCAFDQGFDVKLIENCEYNWTVVPRMYNLHVFDWQCKICNHRTYQGPELTECENCKKSNKFERVEVWKPRLSSRADFARFDRDLHFQYWRDYEKRPESQGDIADLMCFVGACWFQHRERFLELGGLDEEHGSWGQVGMEISAKSTLSGGRLVVNKTTWFSHLFRTRKGFMFPYSLSGNQVERARQYSKWLWIENNWSKAMHPLSWLVERFWPIPGWEENDLVNLKLMERKLA